MIIENKYSKWYFNICNSAAKQGRVKGGEVYYEKHHVIPKILGGTNCPSNLVLLTGREHFVCHLLLTKCTAGRDKIKMQYAISFFTAISKRHNRTLNSRQYDVACKNNSIAKKGKNNPMYGVTPWNKGKSGYLSEEARQRIDAGQKAWRENGGMDTEYREKISRALKGIPKPEGFGKKVSAANSGTKHWSFDGYYCTPFGKFPNSTAIEDIIPNQLVRKWCKNADKKISIHSYNQVPYLQSLGKDIIGKTFRDIGFYFDDTM